MNNKEIIKNIIFDKLSKCNNFNYYIRVVNLKLGITSKKLNHILINNCFCFEGAINSSLVFEYNKLFYDIFLSDKYIWSEIEKETKLQYIESYEIVEDVLKEHLLFRNIIYYAMPYSDKNFKKASSDEINKMSIYEDLYSTNDKHILPLK